MRRVQVIDIDETPYTREQIKALSDDQIKMLISFIDDEKDLMLVSEWSESIVVEAYVNNLIDTVKKIIPEN